ncbi:MAG: 16S rRNA (cytosine(1402)-N(4))-methyltransferase RsmH [Candidatus Portnoybacteria bacterium]|nr:16S rRNA (cytosine(1402)-N(4))-methyltransferase RsmH [Candidatus Portnoybacteria bacterium]
MNHIPVLQKEVVQYLDPKPDENFIDATIGGGGHALIILEKNAPQGKLLGIDLDKKAIDDLEAKPEISPFKKRLILVCDNFSNLGEIVKENNFINVKGILADLGLSSMELEERGRGFSFLRDEPLIMRYAQDKLESKNEEVKSTGKNLKLSEPENNLTAAEILNSWSEEELNKIFWDYGGERFSRQIARKIIEERKIKPIITTFQLVEIIKKATPAWYHHRRIHPATKTFQALRIAVNDELNNLNKFLSVAIDALDSGGRLAIISFHSLEDRIVKNFFKEKKQEGGITILTKKVVTPSQEEILNNPRSRSAKLRAAIKN